jgi:hypothetical protein
MDVVYAYITPIAGNGIVLQISKDCANKTKAPGNNCINLDTQDVSTKIKRQ